MHSKKTNQVELIEQCNREQRRYKDAIIIPAAIAQSALALERVLSIAMLSFVILCSGSVVVIWMRHVLNAPRLHTNN